MNYCDRSKKVFYLDFIIFLISILIVFTMLTPCFASSPCQGTFVDPITDVCWSCMFPISIGSVEVMSGDLKDTDNPSLPVCVCGTPIPRVGITTGFWEPFAMTDVTHHPFCMVTMGGMQLDMGDSYTEANTSSAGEEDNNSFYYVHWYKYPLLFILDVVDDLLCLDTGDIDIAYLTELDATWRDDELGFILDPEAVLFDNPIAQAACASDSIAASTSLPIDSLFWCAGSQGSMYPLSGHIQEHVGGIQASTLISERMDYKMHKEGMVWDSVGEDSPEVCDEYPSAIIPKSRYRYQLVDPIPTVGSGGCHPFGATTSVWGGGYEYPVTGEDFGYLIWRKRNCCAG
jgi:conjugal transfer pilus assembly protein TraU